MTGLFRDRLTGRCQSILPEVPLLGRFTVADAAVLQLHGIDAVPGSVVANNRKGVIRWQQAGKPSESIILPESLLIDETTATSVRSIRDALGHPAIWSQTFESLAAAVLLAPGVSRSIDLLPFEIVLQKRLWHLEAICASPRMTLTVDHVRVPIGRAKRIPPSAAGYLASHTEDWSHRTARGVEPRRIRALIVEDELNIYENRVTVQLIDLLRKDVRDRVRALRRLEQFLLSQLNFSLHVTGSHWRTQRISTLWGEAFETNAEQLRETASRTLATLVDLEQRLAGMLESTLYRGMQGGRSVGASLRLTNVLLNDQHYKWVAHLWRERSRLPHAEAQPAADPGAEAADTAAAWDVFAMLLVCRSLHELGYRQTGAVMALRRGGAPLPLSTGRRGGDVALRWQADGTVELRHASDDRVLRIVGVAAAIAACGEAAVVRRILDELVAHPSVEDAPSKGSRRRVQPSASATAPVDMALLYAGITEELQAHDTVLGHRLNAFHAEGEEQHAALLPVSPLGVDSTERVARLLRWWLAKSMPNIYPVAVSIGHTPAIRASVAGVLRGAATVPSSTGLELSVAVTPHDRQRAASVLRHQLRTDVEAAIVQLDAVLVEADASLRELFSCPTCARSSSDFGRSHGTPATFEALCDDCGTRWGIRGCQSCERRYPFLLPKAKDVDARGEPGWIDRNYGLDVLAEPCAAEDSGAYRCPHCGDCPRRGTVTLCGRCRNDIEL